MSKLPVILVVLDKNLLEEALSDLNLNSAQVEAIIIDGGDDQLIRLDDLTFELYSFSSIDRFFDRKDEFIWLIHASAAKVGNTWRMAKFLLANGIPKDNIVNFIVGGHITQAWLGNIKYIENHAADFFSTGISYAEVGLDIERLTGMRGVNLAGSNQDLRQAYLTAQYVFDHQQSIKFVLIGLAPYSFRYDNLMSFSVCSRNLQYLLALKNSRDDSVHGQLLRMLISNQVKKFFSEATEDDADPNYDKIKRLKNKEISSLTILNWQQELDNLTKEFRAETFEKNLNYLERYIQLCIDHGAKPIGVVFPFSPIINQKYPRDLLSMFRRTLRQLQKAYDFNVIDLFDFPLGYKHFYNMSHLNPEGARLTSILLNYRLYRGGAKSIETMRQMNYDDLYELAFMLNKDDYNEFLSELYGSTAARIRRQDKIKIGFLTYDASMWCGDDLYRLFEQNDRYEPTVFLCLRPDQTDKPLVVKDFYKGVEQLRARGLNVVAVDNETVEIHKQDVLIYLTFYYLALEKQFHLENVTADSLIVYVPHAARSTSGITNPSTQIILMAWKGFFETQSAADHFKANSRTGMPRVRFSGHPKFDYFYRNEPSTFEWKEAQPHSTKIIWAPHWTINGGMNFATFHRNYQFFYEYAKNHPETSWVLKPHPNLLFSAVKEKVFESAEAFEEYLNRWNELPNAKVVTGGYYQEIFVSSDGMILDSATFVTEYQYTHKPLLFLTRTEQRTSEFFVDMLKHQYRADGRDFDGISKFIEEVLIGKNDPLADERKQFFDAHLNYQKLNGMLASEFIFNAIDRELEGSNHNG